MAGRGKLKPAAKSKSPIQEALPVRSPIDDGMRSQMFNLSSGLSNRRSSNADLLPGLPDKAPRKSKGKSPLAKDPKKDGTIEVPGLGSLLEECVDKRHQSNHFGDRPVLEHLDRASIKKAETSNESSSIKIGDESLNAMDTSNESSSIQTGNEGLNANELSNTSSQEGNESRGNTTKKDTSGTYEQSNHGREKWGDVSDEDDKDKGAKGPEVVKSSKEDNQFSFAYQEDPRLFGLPPIMSNSLRTDRNPEESGTLPPDANPLPKSPFKDGRAYSFVSEKEGHKNPNQTQMQESSSVAESTGNRNEGTEVDQQKWVNFLNSPRNSRHNTPNRDVEPKSPAYDPGSRSGSPAPAHNEEPKDDNMVDLADSDDNPDLNDMVDRLSLEENEEQFIEALVERNQKGELNSLEDVIAAIHDIGAESVAQGVPVSFTARVIHKLLQSYDPLGLMIKNYEERQDNMMKDQRKIFRDEMAHLHRKTLERVGSDTKSMLKDMKDNLSKVEKELFALKAENKNLILKHTLLMTEHTLMKARYSSQGNESGDPLAQCQKDLADWQNKYLAKDQEAKMLATQLDVLTNVIQTQGLNLPSPAPAPSWGPPPTNTMASPYIAPSTGNNDWNQGGNSTPAWGSTRPATVNHDNSWGRSLSPATNASSHTYSAEKREEERRESSSRYGNQPNTKGQPGGKGKSKSSGKRGRDPNENMGRDVRQRTQWDNDGTAVARTWAKSAQLRTYLRSLKLEELKALLVTLKQAHSDFQHKSRNTNFENWHDSIDDKFLKLQQDMGMPVKLTTSPHFYYLAAQWPCSININMLSLNELSDPSFYALSNVRKTFYQYGNVHTPEEISQLGECKTLADWKIAKHYLELQKNKFEAYIDRRANFYKVAIVNYDSRPTLTFLSKNTLMQMKRTYNLNKNKEVPYSFTKLFDEAYRNFYTNIMQEIENFAARRTPLEYTQHFTKDIQNLYYFNDDCTGVRAAI